MTTSANVSITKLEALKKEHDRDEPICVSAKILNHLDCPVYVITKPLSQLWAESERMLEVIFAEDEANKFASAFASNVSFEVLGAKSTIEVAATIKFPWREIVIEKSGLPLPQVRMIDPIGDFAITISLGYGLHPFEVPPEPTSLRYELAKWQTVIAGPILNLTRRE